MGITPVLFETLLSTRQAADQLGVQYHTICNWVKNGHMRPAQRFGNSWVFTADEIARVRKAYWPGKRGPYKRRRRSAAA